MTGNGTTPPAPMLMQTIIHEQPGARMIYTDTTGKYIGTIKFDAVSADALKAITAQFQAFVAAQTGGLQVVSGMPGNLPKGP
jgi:hypothetical protein